MSALDHGQSRHAAERIIDHEIARCADCGMPTNYGIGSSYWLTDDLWAQVVGDDSIVLCPECFTVRAARRGVRIYWRAMRDETACEACGGDPTQDVATGEDPCWCGVVFEVVK